MPKKMIMNSFLYSAQDCNICLLHFSEQEFKEKTLKNYYKCSGCRLVSYCGKEHQKLEWPDHRQVCRAISSIMKQAKVEHPLQLFGEMKTKRDTQTTILGLKFLVRSHLDRKLKFYEEELLSYPAFCKVCFKFKSTKPCLNCRAVSYCSESHALEDIEYHGKYCGFLALYYCPFKLHLDGWDKKVPIIRRNPNLLQNDLIECFECITGKKLPVNPLSSIKEYQAFNKAAEFTWIFTICYIIETIKISKIKNVLNIFIVGATFEQATMENVGMEFLFIQNPSLLKIRFYFIGPETAREPERSFLYKVEDKQREVFVQSFPGYLLEDFSYTFKDIAPDLLFAFNCGFSELPFNSYSFSKELQDSSTRNVSKAILDNSWYDGIKLMTTWLYVPVTFTSYTLNEAKMDKAAFLEVVEREGCTHVLREIISTQVNPYRDIRPIRDLYIDDNEEIFFRNSFINCVQFEDN